MINLIKDFRYAWDFVLAGDFAAAKQELKNMLNLALWWDYRCIDALEVHYPTSHGKPAQIVEVDFCNNDAVLYCMHNYLRPGCMVRVYIRYASGKRKRIRLR